MLIFLAIYLSLAVITSIYAAYKTGEEQAQMRVLAPQNVLTVNWVNCFFQGILWFAFWAQAYSFAKVRKTVPSNAIDARRQAADYFGIPRDQVK